MAKRYLLCIHYYFPPVKSGGVYRNYHFAQAFSKYFKHVHVLSSSNVNHREKEHLPLEQNIETHFVKTLDYRSTPIAAEHKQTNYKSSPWFQFLSKLQKTLPFHFLLGEGSIVYIINGYRRACQLIRKHDIEMVYSSFMPYADHLIACLVKRKFPTIKWVADFRDLQVEPLYKNVFFPKFNRWIEKLILRRADLITSISVNFAERLRPYGDTFASPRGIDYRGRITRQDETFRIVYTGNLYQEFRDGELVVRAIAKMIDQTNKECKFIHAGRDGLIWERWFEEYDIAHVFIDKGNLPRKESLALQETADVLVLLTSSSLEYQGVFTGKLFEYLETGIPILTVINGTYDQEFEELFSKLNAGKIVYSPNDLEASQYLLELIFDQKNTESNIQKLQAQYSWDFRAKSIMQKVNLAL